MVKSMSVNVVHGDCRDVLRAMPDESVHCCVTSPPYWGLRDYKIEPSVWGGAWRGVLGFEPDYRMYVEHIVEVFREVRRVLRPDGTLWLNLGDSYASGEVGRHDGGNDCERKIRGPKKFGERKQRKQTTGLKPKNLCGIPWRVAFALQED